MLSIACWSAGARPGSILYQILARLQSLAIHHVRAPVTGTGFYVTPCAGPGLYPKAANWRPEGNEFENEEKELISANVFDLVSAFHRMVERYKDQIVLEIKNEAVTLEEKIKEIRRLLAVQGEVLFSLFFQKKISRLHLAVTFFALLELTRLQEVQLIQEGVFEDIRILAC